MYYWVEITNGKIQTKFSATEDMELTAPYKMIDKTVYDKIQKTPCSFEEDIDGVIVDVEFIPFPSEPSKELTEVDYLLDLDYRLSMIELGL
ncbi:hypothetical protein [Peribacillus asahii]|uniref:hypothetical protein n=1 Tax=Peribacillus asahii TaxID=228899 RepID=UPI003803831D